KVPVSVFDTNGQILSNLTREQFILLDENEPRPIENFLLDTTSIHVMLMLDVSSSLREDLEEIQEAALQFAKAFSREDRIAIVSFSDQLELLQDWTNDIKKLRRSLKHLERGYRTALYDALITTARERLTQVPGKKVIILLTDGLDNESRSTLDDVLNLLIESDISLYIVSRTRLVRPKIEQSERVDFLNQVMKNVLDEDQDFIDLYFRAKETSLTHLAEATGGRVFFPERLEDLRSSYMRVAEELKSQYVLTFRPPASSEKTFRTITVVCTLDIGRIYHRKIYNWLGTEASNH
ncbi:MAG: VWA domain-containing protein, partial [Acidobacteriota bacterium]